MKSKPSVFQPIPLATFSSWAKSAHIVSAQIVKVERWKYLRSTTFWHEFLLIKLAPSSHFAASDLEPPLGSVPPDELDKFTTLLHSGLQVRFDRRVRDDVVCFVGSDDEVDIRLECSLVSTVARREYDNPALLSSIDEHYLGPSLGDIIFFLADMLALHSPSYNLFSRNCWTFASSTVALLEQSFLGDVVIQAVVDKSDTDLVMNMRQRLKAGLGQLFGSPDLGQHVSDAEAFGVSNEAMLTQFGPGTFRFHKDIQEILRSVRRDNERIDPHGRVISKYKRVDGSSTERTSIPLKNHPFRGFMRALGNCDALARDSPSNILDLLFGFQRIVTRPEWVSEALSPGPHVQIAKHLSVAWSTALAADRTLDALLTVLTPFSLPLLNSESVGVKEARVTAIYELYLESSAILDDWAALISISNRPKGLSLNRAHFETLLEMFIPFLTTMSSNEKIRLRLAASGIFRHLLELILDKTCTDMLRALSLELLVLYLDEKYDGVDPKEAAAASVDLLTKRGLSPVTLYSGYRIIQMLIQSSLPASKNAAYELLPVLTRLLHSHRSNVPLMSTLPSCLAFMLRTSPDQDSPWSETRCRVFFREQGLQNVLALLDPKYYRSKKGFQHPMVLSDMATLLLSLTYSDETRETLKNELSKGQNMQRLTLLLEPDALQRAPTLLMSIAAMRSSVTIKEMIARLEMVL